MLWIAVVDRYVRVGEVGGGGLRSWARREVLFSLPFVGAPGVNYIRVPCFQLGVPATTLPPSARCWRFRYNQGLCFPEQG